MAQIVCVSYSIVVQSLSRVQLFATPWWHCTWPPCSTPVSSGPGDGQRSREGLNSEGSFISPTNHCEWYISDQDRQIRRESGGEAERARAGVGKEQELLVNSVPLHWLLLENCFPGCGCRATASGNEWTAFSSSVPPPALTSCLPNCPRSHYVGWRRVHPVHRASCPLVHLRLWADLSTAVLIY